MGKAFFLRILLLIGLTALAYIWVNALMDSMYAYRSPLVDSPPQPGARLLRDDGTQAARRVVFVLIDGLRIDTALDTQVMPYLDKIRRQGAWAVMNSRPASYSQTGFASLFTGAWPEISDGPLLNLDPPELYSWTQDNLFSAAVRAGLKVAVSGHPYNEIIIPQGAVTVYYSDPDGTYTADQKRVEAAIPWLQDSNTGFIFIHLNQVDWAGHHEGGPRDPRWNQAARRADDLLGEIAAQLDLSKDTLFVTSDHGHISTGGHGGHEEIVLKEPFALVGAGVRPGDYGHVNMVDVAPTLAALMGLNLPASSQGRVLIEMLNLPPDEEANIQAAQQAQQQRLLAAYHQAIGAKAIPIDADQDAVTANQAAMQAARQLRLNREMIPRILLALVALILPAYWIVRWQRTELIWLLGGAVLYVLLFHLRYSMLDGLTYSLSSVNSANEIIIYILTTVFMAGILGWLVALLDRGVFRLTPAGAALWSLNLTLVTIWLVSLPLLWSFVLNGLVITWTVPDFPSIYLGFLSLFQIVFIPILGLLLAGLTAGIAWYRQRKGNQQGEVR